MLWVSCLFHWPPKAGRWNPPPLIAPTVAERRSPCPAAPLAKIAAAILSKQAPGESPVRSERFADSFNFQIAREAPRGSGNWPQRVEMWFDISDSPCII